MRVCEWEELEQWARMLGLRIDRWPGMRGEVVFETAVLVCPSLPDAEQRSIVVESLRAEGRRGLFLR